MTRKIFVLALMCVPAVFAADEKLPSAESVLDRFLEVTGGKAAHQKVKTVVMKGSATLPGQGITINITTYSAAPNKRYQMSEVPGMGSMEEGSNGDIAWSRSAMMGP